MLLSEWRKTAPNRECLSNKVLAVLKPVLADLGADGDPPCWVLWGQDPEVRYSIMAPTPAGLIVVAVRLGSGNEGPRTTGKLVRWGKLQVAELSVDSSAGHRIVAVQVEGQVLKGTDEETDQICEFVRGLLAAIDGHAPWQATGPIVAAAAPHLAAVPPVAAVLQVAASPSVPAVPQVAAAPEEAGPTRVAVVPRVATVRRTARPAKMASPKRGARRGLKAVPAAPAPAPRAQPVAAQAAAATPRPRKPARTPGGKTKPGWVAPHPIGLPSQPALHSLIQTSTQLVPATPGAPQPALSPGKTAATAKQPTEPPPSEPGAAWELPEELEPVAREAKRPRTWNP